MKAAYLSERNLKTTAHQKVSSEVSAAKGSSRPQRPVNRSHYRQILVTYLKPQLFKVLLLGVLLMGSIAMQLLNPQIVRYFIDTAIRGGSQTALTRAALLFIGVVFIRQMFSALATYVSEDVGLTATNWLRADLALRSLRLSLSFHNTHSPGEMIERIDGDVTALSNFFSQFTIRLVGSGVLLAGILLLLFMEDWRIGLELLVFSAVTLLLMRRVRGMAVPYFKANRQSVADLSGFWEERLSGTEDIRACGGIDYTTGLHHQLLRSLMRKGRTGQLMSRVFLGTWEVMFALGTAAAFALSAYLLGRGAMTIGGVYLVFYYTSILTWNLTEITQQFNDLQTATASLERIGELSQEESEAEETSRASVAGLTLPPGPLSVEFNDVSFGYVDGNQTLRNISFRLEPGKSLGLLGRTGSGKTTLTRLLFRFYSPDSGAIRLGGMDLGRIALTELRGRVGIVSQEVQLFQASVRDNLTLFDETVSDERLLQVIDELGLNEWYQSLCDGLDTELASHATQLSAGQAQLLALTRLFLQDPGLIILDEASSRLDPLTARLIKQSLDRLLRNRTAIIIAHRLSTVERVDQIMILEEGRILEHGERPSLALDSISHYYELLRTEGEEEILA
jgi:ATP-binding cassette subfamily B protein